ncbi:MAG: hypothetical protein K8J31_18815 [Anaerolineae bacterium]|nr:hypothetical protein [Anaerolineae bacterium]
MALPESPTGITRFYDEVWDAITKGVLKQDSAIIRLWVGRTLWYGLLLNSRIVFVFRGRKMLIIQDRENADFLLTSTNPMRKRRVYGRIRLNVAVERAMMKRDSFEKYVRWKGQEEALSQVTPTLWQRLPRVVRIVLIAIGGVILLYVVFITIGVIGLLIQYS